MSRPEQLYHYLPNMQTAPRYSARNELGVGLGQTHSNLSQALVATNSLYAAPRLISKRRDEAMRFEVPDGSLILEPLQRFLDQSLNMDEDLFLLIIDTGKLATLALRQQQQTSATVRSVQYADYWGAFEPIRTRFVGVSTQEAHIQRRLVNHLEYLNDKVTAVDYAAHKVLQQYLALTSITDEIRQVSLEDRKRLLKKKEETAAQRHWIMGLSVQMLGLPEPEDMAKISKNVELAEGIHGWSQNVVDWLQQATLHLKRAKVHINSLMKIIRQHGTVKWSPPEKDYELIEFLAQIAEGVTLLGNNTAAWKELQSPGIYDRIRTRRNLQVSDSKVH